MIFSAIDSFYISVHLKTLVWDKAEQKQLFLCEMSFRVGYFSIPLLMENIQHAQTDEQNGNRGWGCSILPLWRGVYKCASIRKSLSDWNPVAAGGLFTHRQRLFSKSNPPHAVKCQYVSALMTNCTGFLTWLLRCWIKSYDWLDVSENLQSSVLNWHSSPSCWTPAPHSAQSDTVTQLCLW